MKLKKKKKRRGGGDKLGKPLGELITSWHANNSGSFRDTCARHNLETYKTGKTKAHGLKELFTIANRFPNKEYIEKKEKKESQCNFQIFFFFFKY